MTIDFTRLKNDVNGNPRYVCHFLSLNTEAERANTLLTLHEKYDLALARAKRIGGRKYHNKQYGGGIVFQCYGAADIEPAIENELRKG
jgi:hypothetical protein